MTGHYPDLRKDFIRRVVVLGSEDQAVWAQVGEGSSSITPAISRSTIEPFNIRPPATRICKSACIRTPEIPWNPSPFYGLTPRS
jgi:hypothetical protein